MRSLWKNLRVKIDLGNRKLLCITEILIHSFQKYSLSTNSRAATSQDLSRHKSTIIHQIWLSAWRNIEWGKKDAFLCEGQGNSSGKVTSQQRSEGRDGLSGDSWRCLVGWRNHQYKSSLFIFKGRRATLSRAEATKGKTLSKYTQNDGHRSKDEGRSCKSVSMVSIFFLCKKIQMLQGLNNWTKSLASLQLRGSIRGFYRKVNSKKHF